MSAELSTDERLRRAIYSVWPGLSQDDTRRLATAIRPLLDERDAAIATIRENELWFGAMVRERDAAIRRTSELEAALRNLVDNDTDHFDYEGSKAVPPHDDDRALDDCRECYRIRLDWIDAARAALRSQESQKPPETADNEAAE